jgi:hypothetical protein
MMSQSRMLILIGAICLAPSISFPQAANLTPSPKVMEAIEAAFPEELKNPNGPQLVEMTSPNDHSTCAAVFSRDESNEPTLVAAAFTEELVELAMLSYSSGEAKIISSVPDTQFGLEGGACGLTILNLADPENANSPLVKTIDVTFHDGPDWLFTWDGKKLKNITALRVDKIGGKETPESTMHNANVVDIDHVGAMQIVGNNGDAEKFLRNDGINSSGTYTLFRYNGSEYVPAKTLIALEEFEPNLPKSSDELAAYRLGGAPWVISIAMHRTPAVGYQIRIINGDRDGTNRVSNAKIEVDGVPVIQSTEINQNIETMTRTIQLQQESEIKVTVDGSAKSHLYVVVE